MTSTLPNYIIEAIIRFSCDKPAPPKATKEIRENDPELAEEMRLKGRTYTVMKSARKKKLKKIHLDELIKNPTLNNCIIRELMIQIHQCKLLRKENDELENAIRPTKQEAEWQEQIKISDHLCDVKNRMMEQMTADMDKLKKENERLRKVETMWQRGSVYDPDYKEENILKQEKVVKSNYKNDFCERHDIDFDTIKSCRELERLCGDDRLIKQKHFYRKHITKLIDELKQDIISAGDDKLKMSLAKEAKRSMEKRLTVTDASEIEETIIEEILDMIHDFDLKV
tara:strand:+ start:185 stop:1033 length:849 start_codon:yes stop_codon:yes gene_type:complete